MNKPTAATIAATIKQNVLDLNAKAIDFAEFDRRQRAAWDLVIGRPRIHDRVLDILHDRV
jgi:hypothetical protein